MPRLLVTGWVYASMLVLGLVAHAVNPLDVWLKRAPGPQDNQLNAIACGNGLYVAVGQSNAVVVSTDGTHWQCHREEANTHWNSVAFGNGIFVAAGVEHWPAGGAYSWTNIVMASSNGVDWVSGYLSGLNDLRAVAFGNGRFVMHGGEGSNPWISTDGINWTSDASYSFSDVGDLTWGAGLFAAADYNGIYFSSNGVVWQTQSPPFLGIDRITFIDNRFVALGEIEASDGRDAGILATSPDGQAWTTNLIELPFGYSNARFLGAGYCNGRYVVVGSIQGASVSWTSVNNGQQWQTLFLPGAVPSTLLSESNRVIAVGASGTIAISTNGLVWTNVSGLGSQQAWSVAYGNGRFVGVGPLGTVRTSTDGKAWSKRTIPATNYNWYGVTYGAGKFFAVGRSGVVATSTDASNWVSQILSGGSELMAVAHGNGQFVAVGNGFFNYNAHRVFTSANGLNWSNRLSGSGFSLRGVAYGNGQFVAVGSAGRVLTSPDGITWSSNSLGSTTYLDSVVFGQGAFVAVGASTGTDGTLSVPTICVSTNATSWTTTVITATNTAKFSFYSVAFGDGVFVTAAAYAPSLGSMGGMIFTSTNGQTWQQRARPTTLDFTGLAHGAGTFVAVGPSGVIYQTPNVRPHLRFEPCCGGEPDRYHLVLNGYSNALYAVDFSTNFLDWTRRWTNRVYGGEVEVFSTNAVSSSRFYRAVFVPE